MRIGTGISRRRRAADQAPGGSCRLGSRKQPGARGEAGADHVDSDLPATAATVRSLAAGASRSPATGRRPCVSGRNDQRSSSSGPFCCLGVSRRKRFDGASEALHGWLGFWWRVPQPHPCSRCCRRPAGPVRRAVGLPRPRSPVWCGLPGGLPLGFVYRRHHALLLREPVTRPLVPKPHINHKADCRAPATGDSFRSRTKPS